MVAEASGLDGEVVAWRARLHAASHLSALTKDGLRAKARLLLALQPHVPDDGLGSTLDRLINEGAAEDALHLSLLTDILHLGHDPGPEARLS